MRIAFFTDTYEPQINGVVKSIRSFEDILRKKGHEIFIFCPKGSFKYSKNVFLMDSYEFIPYPEYRVGLPSFEIVEKFLQIKPDVVHVHSPGGVGAIGLALGKIFNIPVVMTYHTLLSEYFSYLAGEDFDPVVERNFTKWFFRKSSLIITPSKSTMDLLKSYGLRNRMVVIPNPIELDGIRKVRKGRNSKPIILHVGRLCKEKKIDIVLRAFKEVLRHKNAKLIITSDGPYRKQLEKLTKDLGIERDIKFTGYLSTGKLMQLYSKADIFVSASDTETQGIVVLEAFANGCPVIARNAIGFKDYIINGKNGLLFNNEKELTQKMLLVLDNRRLREKLVSGGFRIVKNLTGLTIGKQIDDIYRSLSKSKPKLYIEIMYASSLFLGLTQSWFYRKTKLLNNPRFFDFYYRIVKLASKLQYF